MSKPATRMTRRQRLAAVGLLGLFFAQLVMAIPRLSLTADEPVYMGAGYAFLRSGDLRMATAAQHPPLMQELAALPLLLAPGPELATLEGWDTAEMVRFAPGFVDWYGKNLDAATFAARLPVVWVALLWAAFLFRWAADWFGPWGGLVALTLFVFDPNLLAHANLATNDVGFAAFSFITLFAATRLLRMLRQRLRQRPEQSEGLRQRPEQSEGLRQRPEQSEGLRQRPEQSEGLRQRPEQSEGWRYLILAGLALGGSLGSKSSGFFTALVLATLFPLAALPGGPGRARRLARALLQFLLILLLGLLVLWAVYGFELRPIDAGGPPVPLATQWEVWREMGGHLSQGHTAYLMGQVRDTGWLTYYPLAFALKTPPLTLALLALGLVAALAAGPRRWLAMLPLWVYLGGYSAATLLSSVNTGYRFLLPVLPPAFMLVAGLFRDGAPWLRRPALRWGSWALLLLAGVAVAARLQPHYLTYFNFVAGGPAGGHRHLVDSNLDWGQSFKTLETYQEKKEIDRMWLSYYTYADPALYGVRYRPLPPSPGAPPVLPARFNPAPGTYALSATTLHGVMTVDPDMYSWFRQREPVARPGNAIFLYRVPEPDPAPGWLAQCVVPVAPLTPEVVAEGFGRADLRLVYFDCTQSWLYPAGGGTPGWYALHRDTALGEDPFVRERLKGAHLSYQQRADRASPAFVVYEQAVSPGMGCVAAPQKLEGPLDFVGYQAPRGPFGPGDTLEIQTCWRVEGVTERPLSLMLHLVGPGGAPAIVGDGLGVPLENWRAGDVIVQRHRLTLPPDAPQGEYQVLTGAYWLDTLDRWPVLEKASGDGIPLPPVRVEGSP